MSSGYGRSVGIRLLAVLTAASGGLAFWLIDTQMKKGGDTLAQAVAGYVPFIALFLGLALGSVMLLAKRREPWEIRLYIISLLGFAVLWPLLAWLEGREAIQLVLTGLFLASLFIPLGRAGEDPWPSDEPAETR